MTRPSRLDGVTNYGEGRRRPPDLFDVLHVAWTAPECDRPASRLTLNEEVTILRLLNVTYLKDLNLGWNWDRHCPIVPVPPHQ